MKYTLLLLTVVIVVVSCSKSKNTYSTTDHTVGMINSRSWAGLIHGYAKGDTVLAPDTTHISWPKGYSRTISDTTFSVIKVNGFSVNVLGVVLAYRSTDSTTKIVEYDSVVTGTMTARLRYYYAVDSMAFYYHKIDSVSIAASQYYQITKELHTK